MSTPTPASQIPKAVTSLSQGPSAAQQLSGFADLGSQTASQVQGKLKGLSQGIDQVGKQLDATS